MGVCPQLRTRRWRVAPAADVAGACYAAGVDDPSPDPLAELVARLDTHDPAAVRAAGDALLRRGEAAVEPLLGVLAGGSPDARKAAAFLLGRLGGAAAGEALERAVQADPEPKVRKNAAAALGRRGAARAAPALIAALEAEEVAWVRPSLVLALGRLGGPEARRAVGAVSPRSPAEAEAVRKAGDRLAPGGPPRAAWRAGAVPRAEVWAAVPLGLEDVAVAEAAAAGLGAASSPGPGRLRFPAGVLPRDPLPRLRCLRDVRLLLAIAPAPDDRAGLPGRAADLLAGAPDLADWPRWLDAEAPLRYRLALPAHLDRARRRDVLAAVRRALVPLDLADSPSHYAVQLAVDADGDTLRAWLLPAFQADERFAYRVSDVGAAIDPAVAAGLVRRLGIGRPGARVLDPTCGSATLLVERARAGGAPRLRGLDVSPTAVAAARANLAAAGLAADAEVVRADAADPGSWSAADEVIANLPFGGRSRRQDRDLDGLYAAVVHNLARHLAPGGRALLYTAAGGLLRAHLETHRDELVWHEERPVSSGGLTAGVWRLGRAGDGEIG